MQSTDLLQHGKPMSIKESHCTRKKKKKRGAKSTLQQISHFSPSISHCHPTSRKKKTKKKRSAWKYQEARELSPSLWEEPLWKHHEVSRSTIWLCIHRRRPVRPSVHRSTHHQQQSTLTVSYLLLLLCFALKFEAFLKEKSVGVVVWVWFCDFFENWDGVRLKAGGLRFDFRLRLKREIRIGKVWYFILWFVKKIRTELVRIPFNKKK